CHQSFAWDLCEAQVGSIWDGIHNVQAHATSGFIRSPGTPIMRMNNLDSAARILCPGSRNKCDFGKRLTWSDEDDLRASCRTLARWLWPDGSASAIHPISTSANGTDNSACLADQYACRRGN